MTSEPLSRLPLCLMRGWRGLMRGHKYRDMRQQKLEGPAAATPCFIGKYCNLSQFMSQINDITSLKQGPKGCG